MNEALLGDGRQRQNQASSNRGKSAVQPEAQLATISNAFNGDDSAIDVGGATDGNYIVSDSDNYQIYSMSGSSKVDIDANNLFCSEKNVLAVCSEGGFPYDIRTVYDTLSKRWIVTGLWLGCNGNNGCAKPVQDVIAVSATSDPTGIYYAYEFNACGSATSTSTGDQPHVGYSSTWIVITTGSCGASSNSLTVINKSNIYAGNPIGGKYYQIPDPVENQSPLNYDNPVLTYTITVPPDREYLTGIDESALNSSNKVNFVYSYIDGLTNAPVLHSMTSTVDTNFTGYGAQQMYYLSAPGCTGCIPYFSLSTIHSSGLYAYTNLHPYILSTVVTQYPTPTATPLNESAIESVAFDTLTNTASSIQIVGGAPGAGFISSEIAMPISTSGSGTAVIGYGVSTPDFYPGLRCAIWDLSTNTITEKDTIIEGNATPTGFYNPPANKSGLLRWNDFISALTPNPNGGSVVIGGSYSSTTAINNQYDLATYWATVTPP